MEWDNHKWSERKERKQRPSYKQKRLEVFHKEPSNPCKRGKHVKTNYHCNDDKWKNTPMKHEMAWLLLMIYYNTNSIQKNYVSYFAPQKWQKVRLCWHVTSRRTSWSWKLADYRDKTENIIASLSLIYQKRLNYLKDSSNRLSELLLIKI